MDYRFAAIFKYKNGKEKKYICDDLSIVKMEDQDNFNVSVGKYTGYDNSTIKRIIEDDMFDLEKEGNEITIENDNKRFAIFIFDNKALDELADSLPIKGRVSALREIRDYLQNIDLVSINGNKYEIKKSKEMYFISLAEVFAVKKFWAPQGYDFSNDNNLDIFSDEELGISDNKSNLNQQNIYKVNNINNADTRKFVASMFIPFNDKQIEDYNFSLEDFPESKKQRDEIEAIDVEEFINNLSNKIVGQEDVITTLVTNIYYNQFLIDSIDYEDNKLELDSRKVSILLDGSTGTGKTAIVKEISDKFGIPSVVVNANSFSETGYVGPTITDTLKRLIEAADGDLDFAERGIIIFDEIDKIAKNNEHGKDMKKGVQEELLGFVSGGTYKIDLSKNPLFNQSINFDTSKLTFIFSGAFTDLRESKIKEKTSHSIGFNNLNDEEENTYVIDSQDYIDYGLLREFFGRIKVIANTKTYTKEDLKEILLKSEISPLINFEKDCIMYGCKGISYDDEFIDKLCDIAISYNTGARGLQTKINEIKNLMLFDLTTRKYEGQTINLTKEIFNETEKKKIRRFK